MMAMTPHMKASVEINFASQCVFQKIKVKSGFYVILLAAYYS